MPPLIRESGKSQPIRELVLMVPTGTPRDIVELLNREIATILTLPDVKRRWNPLGLDSVGDTPDEFAANLRTELDKWGNVVAAAHIRIE